MPTIFIATTNAAKRDEFVRYLNLSEVEYKTLKDFPDIAPFEEHNETFEENAIAKAQYYATHSKLPTLAGDGGLCIDALNGEPGVHSRRWSGTWTGDEELVGLVMEKLKSVPSDKRTARLELAVCCALPTGECYSSSSHISGFIAETVGPYPPGFPYRGLLLVEPFKKYYSELTPVEHERVNHWRKALEELKPQILTLLNSRFESKNNSNL